MAKIKLTTLVGKENAESKYYLIYENQINSEIKSLNPASTSTHKQDKEIKVQEISKMTRLWSNPTIVDAWLFTHVLPYTLCPLTSCNILETLWENFTWAKIQLPSNSAKMLVSLIFGLNLWILIINPGVINVSFTAYWLSLMVRV